MQKQPERELYARAAAIAPIAAIIDAAAAQPDAYLVGGTIRDLLLGRAFVDIDLAVDGDAHDLAAALGSPQPLSESRFSTLRVSANGCRYDIARTRSERYAHPGALPQVEPAPIATDLMRRDFTVNAFALALTGESAGTLLAAPDAHDDLQSRELAVLHDASFHDDPTRLLRLARYAARLGFEIAPRTRQLATEAIAGGALETVSGTRIGNELRLLAGEPDPVAAFEATAELGLPWSLNSDTARRALEVLPEDGRADLLVLACVLGAQASDGLTAELDRLGFTAADRETIVAAAKAQDLAGRLTAVATRSGIARTVGTSGIETVALAFSQGAPSQSLTWLQDLRHLQLQITGDDLIASGIPEGPRIGRALDAAREALYDGAATERDAQLRVALSAAS
ncbi:MAG: CCA tRNA nucleotidyltransferase [Acidobacteriota bacterium]|nr:CCA tRNA nucleotidyltransferase [Acidobacteriota bacterium]